MYVMSISPYFMIRNKKLKIYTYMKGNIFMN